MTGAVAAMAEPPQMDEPTPISVEISDGMCSTLCSTNATMSAVAMVDRMMGSDMSPTSAICARFRPNPNSTTAACSTFLPVNAMPGWVHPRVGCFQNAAMAMPAKMANTGPPTRGNACPMNQQGRAMARQTTNPGRYFITVLTFDPSFPLGDNGDRVYHCAPNVQEIGEGAFRGRPARAGGGLEGNVRFVTVSLRTYVHIDWAVLH